MKILWIPGRKRHDRKGIYSSTNKEVNKNYLPQKKNQVWALGGNEQRKLININANDDIASSSSDYAMSVVNPLCVAAGTAGTSAAIKEINSDDKLNLDEKLDDQEKIVDKEILKNGDASGCNDNIDIDVDEQLYHNAQTMRFRKKTGSDHTDLDSIEHLDFEDERKKNEGFEDDIDSVSMHRLRTESVPSRRRRKSRRTLKNLEKEKTGNQKVVDCLAWGMVCCDMPCSIL